MNDYCNPDSKAVLMILQVRDYRADWPLSVTIPVAGNYYPVIQLISNYLIFNTYCETTSNIGIWCGDAFIALGKNQHWILPTLLAVWTVLSFQGLILSMLQLVGHISPVYEIILLLLLIFLCYEIRLSWTHGI